MKKIENIHLRRTLIYSVIIVLTGFMSSCSTNQSVTNGAPIQKRKYNKGYYLRMFEKKNTADASEYANYSNTRMSLPQEPENDREKRIVDSYAPDATGYVSSENSEMQPGESGNTPQKLLWEDTEPVEKNQNLSDRQRNRLLKKSDEPGSNEKKPDNEKPDKMALWSFILAMAGTFGLLFPYLILLPIILFPVALILGFIGLKRTKGRKKKGHGLALTAVILSCVYFFIFIITTGFFLYLLLAGW